MKYKGIELVEDTDSELFCEVEFLNEDEDDEVIDILVDKILDVFTDFKGDLCLETVTPEAIDVRSFDITFDEQGIELLKEIYDKLSSSDIQANILVGIVVDTTWFKRADGSEYNLDLVLWDEFLTNLSY